MVITLIGYRGSGKTTVAGALAARLGWEWIDADAELERRDGRSIREIFDTDGEAYFRRLERETIVDLLCKDRFVLAAGGGAILDGDSRADIQAAGPVVWLHASIEKLYDRIESDETTSQRRPNLTAAGGRREIEEVLTQREPLYRECASIMIRTDELTTEQIVDQILDLIDVPANGET